MNRQSAWLPPLLNTQAASTNWPAFENAIYTQYDLDFLSSQPKLFGLPVRPKAGLICQKNAGFWHLISKGVSHAATEIDRLCDLDRCARIGWPRAMIQAVGDEAKVLWWENHREREPRTLIALTDFSYKVVLANRAGYYILWTAMINLPHQQATDHREWKLFSTK